MKTLKYESKDTKVNGLTLSTILSSNKKESKIKLVKISWSEQIDAQRGPNKKMASSPNVGVTEVFGYMTFTQLHFTQSQFT